MSDLSKIRHVEPLDPVASDVTSQPTRAIELRLRQIEDLLTQLTNTTVLNQLIIYNVLAANDVVLHDVVYFNPNRNLYEKALASVTLKGTTFDFNPSAIAMGVVVKVNAGNRVDILVGGYDLISSYRDAGSSTLHFLENNEVFQPGVPYYLSARVPGKVTRFAPTFKIQVLVASDAHFVMAPSYANPDSVENVYPVALGMRPVGSVRQVPPSNDHVQIVGFDALEKVSRTENGQVFNEWRTTNFDAMRFDPNNPHTGIPAHRNFGYMVADATVIKQPTSPIFVGIQVAAGDGVITAWSALSLNGLFDINDPDHLGTQIVTPALGAGNFGSAASDSATPTPRTYIVRDAAGITLGTIEFFFTDPDVSRDRMVIFSFPASFQGWKMVNPPEVPAATCTLNGGAVDVITLTSRGYGYLTPPSVIFSDAPEGGTTAKGVAILDDRGCLARISVDVADGADLTPGAGYLSAPTITLTGQLLAVTVVNGGRGFAGDPPTLTVSAPDDPIVANREQATVEAVATTNIIESVDRLNGGAGYTSGNVPAVVIEGNAQLEAVMTTDTLIEIPILDGGSGYLEEPTITITDATGAGAVAKAIMKQAANGNGMAIDYIRVTDGGGSYTAPAIEVTAPAAVDGVPATLGTPLISGAGVVNRIDVLHPGSGYTPALELVGIDVYTGGEGYPSAAASAPYDYLPEGFEVVLTGAATNAVAWAAVTDGVITRVLVISRGVGYTAPPGINLTDNGGTGSGAVLIPRMLKKPLIGFVGGGGSHASFELSAANVVGGAITGTDAGNPERITPTVPGSGYEESNLPAVHFIDLAGTATRQACGYLVLNAGTVEHLVITDGGEGYTTPPVVALSGGKGAEANPVVGGYITGVTVLTPGKGYSFPPSIRVGNGSAAETKGAAFTTAISGDGGSRSPYKLQTKRFADDLGSAHAKPPADFYYNMKADPSFKLRWPPVPVDKATVVMNGVEITAAKVDEGSGALSDPGADVGMSRLSLFWTTSHADGCPWDQYWEQYRRLSENADAAALIPGSFSLKDDSNTDLPAALVAETKWYWWEALSLFEGNRNRALLYINQLGRLHQTGKVTSLQVISPLKMVNLTNGIDSAQTDVPMTGHLLLSLDNQASFLSTTSPQIDLARSGEPKVVYQNTTGKKVYVSSFLIENIFQRNAGTVPVVPENTARITMGTQRGSYRDLVGMLNPSLVATPGIDVCLLAQGQFKELMPDASGAPAVVLPGESIYISVDTPAGGPILTQIVTVRTRGYAF